MTRHRAALILTAASLLAALLLAALLYLSRPRPERLHIPGIGDVQLATPEARERMRRAWENGR